MSDLIFTPEMGLKCYACTESVVMRTCYYNPDKSYFCESCKKDNENLSEFCSLVNFYTFEEIFKKLDKDTKSILRELTRMMYKKFCARNLK